MPRQPKLRKKTVRGSTYWFTSAGATPTYFGNVLETSFEEARKQFAEYLASLANGPKPGNGVTVAGLVEIFLDWIAKSRSTDTYEARRSHLNKFGNLKIGGKPLFDLPADRVRGSDLKAFLESLKRKKLSAQTILHHETSVRHCWNWATKHPSPHPYLSPTFRPFAAVERTYVPRRVLTEDGLMTDSEAVVLFEAARVNLDIFHAFGPKVPRKINPYENFADMLRCYYHTGARTHELARVTVGDVLNRTKQIALGNHKTSRTQREQRIRHVTLNDDALSIFDRFSTGKNRSDPIFTSSDGKRWAMRSLHERFRRVKEIASTKEIGDVRDHITIYDFRHLWISEMLMAGNDVATVARMAGTSIAMIERTYGHFRNEHLQEAQARLDAVRRQRASKTSTRRNERA